MSGSKPLLATASAIAYIACISPAAAQDSAPTGDGQEIVVTGYRASIAQSIDAKRDLSVIADVITAEDIGKFPDRNVAEALQRVPGIVINREYGEGERVSLRGTAPNLTRTTVNGHAIATADWFILDQLASTRSFNYLTLPSEIVGKIEVYKSPQADIEEGGVGGTINVNTRNPLDLPSFTVSGSAQLVYSDRSDKTNPQFSGLVSWKNDAETFGILIGGVYQRREIRRDGVEVLGYQTVPGAAADSPLAPSLIGSALFQQDRERYGGNIGIQVNPSDAVEINVTGLYAVFNADNFNQNYLAWTANALGGGGTLTDTTVEDNTYVKGTVTSTPGGRAVVYDAIDRFAKAKTASADFDLNWHPTDGSTLHFKAGWTKASGDTTSQPFYEGGAPGGFTYDLTGRAPQVSFTGIDPDNPDDLIFDFASLHQITNDDEEKYVYLDYEHALDLGPLQAIKVGVKYTDHDRETGFLATTYGGFFLPLAAEGCGGPCLSSDFAGGSLPSDFLKNIASPGTLTSYFNIDRKKLEQIFFSQPESVRARILNPPENFTINEKTYGGYVMAKLGGDRWSGNFGLRIVRTDQRSSGNILGVPPGPGTVDDNAFGVYLPVTIDRSYTDFLPSVNLSYDLTDAVKLRFAAGRVVARPDYTDIVPRVSLNPGALTASGGDPFVNPFRANQYDLSLEWYPERDTIVAAALYYKDIQSYIVNRTIQETFPVETATPNLSRCTPSGGSNPNLYDCVFDVNRRSNGSGGTNKGIELQVSRPLWGGFGALVNYTYSDAKSEDGDPIPGNSKHALNLTGYYESDLFSARLSYNYRSKFFIDIDRASPLNQKATSSLDASLSVHITENVSLFADAVNLTNEKIEQYSGTTARPRAIYDNGRQFYFGVRGKF
ncbi:TonB-dependent receptor [Sphingopyxis indica]|uniref:TonB-dependent receptor n=1 Tax=Sphingopyxis indica TaxID=436663 RepID=UPI002938D611|nr:TonB-dependent receptor [Sphingopyxis indica]WOF42248.1 TonB-dependent receptor [Sphingopyxis indica]